MQSPNTALQYELKYCERCGGLWLRPVGEAAVYCEPCALLMDALPLRRGPRRATAAGAIATAMVITAVSLATSWLAIAGEAFA